MENILEIGLRKSLMNGITVTEEFVKILEHETKRAS